MSPVLGRIGLLATVISVSCAAWPQALLSSSTELQLPNQVPLPPQVIKLILRSDPQEAALLDECMKEHGLNKTAAAKFFAATTLHLNRDGLSDYFVRPALKPYCRAFYGAHLFRYWFVTAHRERGSVTYDITFKNGGDEVHVLRSRTHGYLDLELLDHTASELYTTLMHFNGRQYQEVRCVKHMVSDDDDIPGTPCPTQGNSND